MTVWAFGDCHTAACYAGIGGIAGRWTVGYTMRRISWEREPLFPAALRQRHLFSRDVVLAGWGELDVRWRMRARVELEGLGPVVRSLVDAYLLRLDRVVLCRVAVGAVMPPVRRSPVNAMYIPADVTDGQRLEYTEALNSELGDQCWYRRWPFVNLFSYYAGRDGFLDADLTDAAELHASTSGPAREALRDALRF
jgi:hypothetical protein